MRIIPEDITVAATKADMPGVAPGHGTATQKTCWFLVVQVREQWWVDCEGKGYGPFETRDEASESARRLAEIFGDGTRQSQVWAPDEEGHMRLAWQGPRPRSGG